MNNIEEIEENIYQALKSTLNNVNVELYPNNPTSYIAKGKNNILVKYDGVTYSQPEMRQQIANMQYKVTLIVKDLRGKQGLYELARRVKQVIGNMNTYGYNFYVASEFVADYNEEQGVWIYELNFIIRIPSNIIGV